MYSGDGLFFQKVFYILLFFVLGEHVMCVKYGILGVNMSNSYVNTFFVAALVTKHLLMPSVKCNYTVRASSMV